MVDVIFCSLLALVFRGPLPFLFILCCVRIEKMGSQKSVASGLQTMSLRSQKVPAYCCDRAEIYLIFHHPSFPVEMIHGAWDGSSFVRFSLSLTSIFSPSAAAVLPLQPAPCTDQPYSLWISLGYHLFESV